MAVAKSVALVSLVSHVGSERDHAGAPSRPWPWHGRGEIGYVERIWRVWPQYYSIPKYTKLYACVHQNKPDGCMFKTIGPETNGEQGIIKRTPKKDKTISDGTFSFWGDTIPGRTFESEARAQVHQSHTEWAWKQCTGQRGKEMIFWNMQK